MTETQAGKAISALDLLHEISPGWVRNRRFSPIPDQPIVHAVRTSGSEELIEQVASHLGAVVPHAVLDVGPELAPLAPDADRNDPEAIALQREQSVQVRTLLDDAVNQLRDHGSAKRMGRLRFPRYALTSWLLKKNLRATDADDPSNNDVRDELHSYLKAGRRKHADQDNQSAAAWSTVFENLPWYVAIFALVAFPLYYAWWIRRGRVPRWLLRQHYLAPKESADFPGFAQRLIRTPSENENADQVRKLLVHAFLSDLADSYHRWRWRSVPKDCYPVLLLKDLRPGTVGELLVRLLNDVRNETGARDPLLVIAAGDKSLPGADAPPSPITLAQWKRGLTNARRKRSHTAWYVPQWVSGRKVELPGRAVLRRKHSKRWRRVPLVLVILLVLGSTTGYALQVRHHCGLWMPWRDTGLANSPAGECVGLSDTYTFSADVKPKNNPDPGAPQTLGDAQQAIMDNNTRALAENPGQWIPTVVYLGMLTSAKGSSSALEGTVQDLRGVIKAQEDGFERGKPVRVLLANGGTRMERSAEVAEQIVAAAKVDPRIVGVIGLAGSWDSNVRAVRTLGEAGIPTIGTTTSSSELPRSSDLFYQIAPGNEREAEIIAHYLAHVHTRPERVHIYYSRSDRLYSEDLAVKSEAALRAKGIDTMMHALDDSKDEQGPLPCGGSQTALFADRADAFSAFLSELQSAGCETPPHLLASDDTSKFVLAEKAGNFIGTTIDYVSFYESAGPQPSGLDGRGLLSLDAVNLVLEALDRAGQDARPLNGQTVWRGITSIDGAPPLPAASGDLGFWTSGENAQPVQVPVDKAISVLRVRGGSAQTDVQLQCGRGVKQQDDCPPG